MILQTFNGMGFRPYPKDTLGTLVCLAGSEAKEYINMFIDMKVPYILGSFFYLRRKFKRNKNLISRLKEEYANFDYIFMDSGGYTLQQEKRRGKLKVSLSDYMKEYRDFAMEMQGHVTVFGAIDSLEDKYDFEDYMEHVYDFKDNGIHIAPTVFVDTDWKLVGKYRLSDNFDIIALSGARFSRAKAINQFARLKKSGVKVHGYAATGQDHFQYFHRFYSVDSISWLMAQRYGLSFNFSGGKLRTISPYAKMENRRNVYAKYGKDFSIDFNAVQEENILRKTKQSVSQQTYDEVNKLNVIPWIKLAEQEAANPVGSYWFKRSNKFKDSYNFYEE